MAEPIIAAECGECGAKLTMADTLALDPYDDRCAECGADALIWLLEGEGEDDVEVSLPT